MVPIKETKHQQRQWLQHNTTPRFLTNVNVRLGTLENRSQPTGSQTVLGENMLHRVDGARPQQGRPAGARKQIGGSGDARHPDDQQVTNTTTRRNATEGRQTDTRWREKNGVEMEQILGAPLTQQAGQSGLQSNKYRVYLAGN